MGIKRVFAREKHLPTKEEVVHRSGRTCHRALAKLEVARGSLTMPSQAAAVQKRLAADVALLRAAALVPHVEDEV